MLKCINISKNYNKQKWFTLKNQSYALNNISLSIKHGRSMGLLGTNGSGKSTLTRIILGLEKPTTGNVIFDGKDIHKMIDRGNILFRKNIQAVFQDPISTMNPRWSAFKIIIEPLINYNKYSKDRLRTLVAKLMESVNLEPNDMDKNINCFSGGQQQRISIARALALNPKLLILDEAVSNLDMIIQSQIVELIQKLKNIYNISLLLISHDIRIVFKLCEDITVLDKGVIVERLSIENGIDSPKSQALKKLLKSAVTIN